MKNRIKNQISEFEKTSTLFSVKACEGYRSIHPPLPKIIQIIQSMKLCFIFLIVPLVCVAGLPLPEPNIPRAFITQFKGFSYDFRLSKSALEKAPKWNSDSQFPPLSPIQAQIIAFTQIKKLVPEQSDGMIVNSISLESVFGTDWIYAVRFRHNRGGFSSEPRLFTIPVLFDGSTISPVIRDLHQQSLTREEAIKIASQFKVGMLEADASKLLAKETQSILSTGGLSGWNTKYILSDGSSLCLDYRNSPMATNWGQGSGVLQRAFIASNEVTILSITLTNAP